MSGRRVKKDYTNPLLQSTTEPDTATNEADAQQATKTAPTEQTTPTIKPTPAVQVPVEEAKSPQEPELSPPLSQSTPAPPVIAAEPPSPMPLPDHTRMRYPEGDGYDKRNEYLPTYVVRGIRALADDLVKRTGQNKTTLSSVAWIMLLEDAGYDMSAFKEKLPHYYRLKEMEALVKSLEERQKGGTKKRRPDG